MNVPVVTVFAIDEPDTSPVIPEAAIAALAYARAGDTKSARQWLARTHEAVRNNRLALLSELRELFLDVADISRLAIG